jgi:glycosyltransferase involved in cell wall biosynthesis
VLPVKVLLTTEYEYPQHGGLGTYIFELKKGLEAAGHEVDVLAAHPKYSRYYTVNGGWFIGNGELEKIVRRKYPSLFQSTAKDTYISDSITDIHKFSIACERLGLNQYDIIHAQDVVTACAVNLVKPKQIPLVTSIHACTPIEEFDNGVIKRNSKRWRYCARLDYNGVVSSDKAIVSSKWLKEMLFKHSGAPSDRLTVIPNGIDTAAFLKRMGKKTNNSRPSSRQIIVCVARLVKDKGHRYLLYALAELLKRRRDWICWLVGDGDLRKKLVLLRNHLGLQKHVVFMGNRNDVPALMKRANVVVLTSLNENCPYVVMEAQVAGKAMIASDVGGIPEMIEHGETGMLVPARKFKPLFRSIWQMLADRTLRRRIEMKSSSWGRDKWSNDKMVSSTLDVYHKVSGEAISKTDNRRRGQKRKGRNGQIWRPRQARRMLGKSF